MCHFFSAASKPQERPGELHACTREKPVREVFARPSLLFAGLQRLGKLPQSSRDAGACRSAREFCPTSSKSLACTGRQMEGGGKPPPPARLHRFGPSRGRCNHSSNIVAAYLADSGPATAMLAHEPFSCIFSRALRQHS